MSSSLKDKALMSFDEYANSLEIPSEELDLATNNFFYKNILKDGSTCMVFSGQLFESGELINIVARTSTRTYFLAHELEITQFLNHKNIVSAYKISMTEIGLVTINKYMANESLDKHLSGSTLSWMQRLHICVEVAHALRYLHYHAYADYHVIHANIKSSKVLLNDDFKPKLNGFGFAVKAKKHELQRISKYEGSEHYMDPACVSTNALSNKSDVFSFGVLLFEVLFGREASSIKNSDNWYFARLAQSHYEEGKLDDLIHPDLRKQMNVESLNIFAEIAYYCLKAQRSQRPDINQVLPELEKALELQHKYEHRLTAGASLSKHLKGKSVDHLRFRLRSLQLATDNFSEGCCIGSGGYGKVYKAELDLDETKSWMIKLKNKAKLTKKHSMVAIKRIFSRNDGQGEQSFLAEIGMLSNCKHPNVVSLHGFCDEGKEMILVYEYISNGSLADYLENIYTLPNLDWAQRIQICLDIAHGLEYLHTSTHDKQSIIHRDIKSANILLDNNWVAKIADFGLSKLHPASQQGSTLITNNIAGTEVYLDPEYMSTGKLKTKSDVYSFGVVMFEILCGKLAYDKTYGQKGLPPIARRFYDEGTMNNLVDQKIMEVDEIFILTGGVNKDSLDIFTKVAYQCLAETQSERPTTEIIIKELVKALNFQKNSRNNLSMSLNDIKMGTKDFDYDNYVEDGIFWLLYEGEVANTSVFVKRWFTKSHQTHIQFLTELDILFRHKHDNIISLVGYCIENEEQIIVYEHASNGRLKKHLSDPSLTWKKRLKICINVAKGLEFLHEGGVGKGDGILHRDIKSSSILLDHDWNAKISNLDFSCKETVYESPKHVDDKDCNSMGYIDPEYESGTFLTKKSDIYSLGVVLFEMLCGRPAWTKGCVDHSQSLGPLALSYYKENKNFDDMIFMGIKEQIAPQSFSKFYKIAIRCIKPQGKFRPTASKVVLELEKAMEIQEDYETWEAKLPIDYKEIISLSKTRKIYDSIEMTKDLHDVFTKGILLQDDKVLFSVGGNGERNEMISARIFSYKNRSSRKWTHVHESRFEKVAEIFDISKLNIRIKTTTRFLSPGVNYGAYLIFKFCDSRKYSSKSRYVNLKYRKGGENLNAYFARWRDEEWMMIELYRFSCEKKDTKFEVLLESFSRYYCGKSSIYIEGIEFRVINDVKNEEATNFQQFLKSNSKPDQLLSLHEVNKKKHLMLSATDVLYDFSNVNHFRLKSSTESRFQHVIELLPQHVFRINCKIQSRMLSQDTEYFCFLIFKVSEKCVGLNCPVIVRDLIRRNNKEADIIYLRSPSSWNLHENNNVPQHRDDGWMEVKLWKFNSNHHLKNSRISVNLKLITYEGTMSGLIVCGLEFRSSM